ncbi:hypothetical protein TREES_T100012231 [Tupaia chinensis]|uniref:Uncharacterized protein n=1 Tax=Tupaia chinensis TaxID=246437 RepID=L9JH40_TUPCH|nr:hypothetical protein TREES_T100012231 [Tupaia chinensis]
MNISILLDQGNSMFVALRKKEAGFYRLLRGCVCDNTGWQCLQEELYSMLQLLEKGLDIPGSRLIGPP